MKINASESKYFEASRPKKLQSRDQAKPMQKWLPIRNRGPFLQIRRLGCRRSQKLIFESRSVYTNVIEEPLPSITFV
jgi:hypothetical protein